MSKFEKEIDISGYTRALQTIRRQPLHSPHHWSLWARSSSPAPVGGGRHRGGTNHRYLQWAVTGRGSRRYSGSRDRNPGSEQWRRRGCACKDANHYGPASKMSTQIMYQALKSYLTHPNQIKWLPSNANSPLAPLKGLLAYQPPKKFTNHQWTPCRCSKCIMCGWYTTNQLNVPITPYINYRCLYFLYHEQSDDTKHLYLGSTLDPKVTPHNPIANHLTKGLINWQILSLLFATYKAPYQSTDPKVIEWKRKLAKAHPEAIIPTYPHHNSLYNETIIDQKK